MLNQRQLKILEGAFVTEVMAAVGRSPSPIFQMRSKLADALCRSGHLKAVSVEIPATTWPRVSCVVQGFELTELGRIAYCESCEPYQDFV